MITRAKAAAVVLCAFIALGTAVPTLLAVPLPPGLTLPAVAEPNPVGGTTIASSGPVPFSAGTFAGTLLSSVISGDTSNPLGGLTFTYQFTNNPASTNVIQRLTVTPFTGFITDVSWQPILGVAPALMDRSAISDVIGFSFIGPPIGPGTVIPGQSSPLLVVQTNAPAYTNGTASLIDGSAIAGVATFAPLPEPVTLAILALGMTGTLLCRRPRSRL